MKLMKKYLKILFIIVITAILSSAISVYATYNYFAKDISYKPSNANFNVDNVEDDLNELYKMTTNFDNSELLYSSVPALLGSGSYTFDGTHSKIIVVLFGCSRDNNVSLSCSISAGDIIYDKTLYNYHDTWSQGRLILLDNVPNESILSYSIRYQPGIFIYGI